MGTAAWVFACAASLACTGCITTQNGVAMESPAQPVLRAPGADLVRVTRKPEDVARCTALGGVTSFDRGAGLQNQAVGLHADTVFVYAQPDSSPSALAFEGVAYRCGPPAAQ